MGRGFWGCWLAFTLSLLWVQPAPADIANAPGAQLEVSLITYGPGEVYWERFGHDAIEIRDRADGQAISFNYGLFDFNQNGFLLNFARGRMSYLMGADNTADDESVYQQAGRSITRQQLALTPEQASALRDFLLWNLRPENAHYRYDYFTSNCSTRVRDALDQTLGGIIAKKLQGEPAGLTYRQQTDRLMSAQPWLMLILDLGLGPYADQPLSAWQESFLPMVLQQDVRQIQVNDGHGGTRPLVTNERVVSPTTLVPPPAQSPDLRVPLGLAGLVLAGLLLALWRYAPLGYALLATLFLLLAGTAGVLMLVLWTLTAHHSAWANANLLLFNPLAYGLMAAAWRARRRIAVARWMDRLIIVQLVAILVALLLHLLPGVVQQNQPWIGFALPCWLALAWTLRRGGRLIAGPEASA